MHLLKKSPSSISGWGGVEAQVELALLLLKRLVQFTMVFLCYNDIYLFFSCNNINNNSSISCRKQGSVKELEFAHDQGFVGSSFI